MLTIKELLKNGQGVSVAVKLDLLNMKQWFQLSLLCTVAHPLELKFGGFVVWLLVHTYSDEMKNIVPCIGMEDDGTQILD